MAAHDMAGRFGNFRGALGLCVLLSAAGGCGGDDGSTLAAPPSRTTPDGGGFDSPADSSVPDIKTGYENELRSEDGQLLCGYEAEDIELLTAHRERLGSAVAGGKSGLAMAFVEPGGALQLGAVAKQDALAEPVTLVARAAGAYGPLLASDGEDFVLLWRQVVDGATAVRSRDLRDPATGPVTLWDAVREPEASQSPVALTAREGGYVAAALVDGGVSVRRLDPGGVPDGDAVTFDGAAGAVAVQLAPLADDETLLAWLMPGSDGDGEVMAMVLDDALQARGEASVVSKSAVSTARFRLAGRAGSVGLIYETRELERDAVKFRRIEDSGDTDRALLNAVSAPERGVDASIAAFGQGYVVAYRALPSPGVPTPRIRVVFINQFGRIVHEGEVDDAADSGGPVAVGATTDGYVVVTRDDVRPSGGVTLTRIRMWCPGALVLCGGEPE